MSIQIPVDAPTNCLAANESFEKARLVYDREGEPDVNEVLLDIATGLHHLAQAMAVKCHEIAVAIEA